MRNVEDILCVMFHVRQRRGSEMTQCFASFILTIHAGMTEHSKVERDSVSYI